mmetsp:Transcript_13012/g.22862  ORF Transcript_13012/g.22862 Transcript_13012/m.22862 type:complete len:209 (+) Transcript_13012:636-1262(+)
MTWSKEDLPLAHGLCLTWTTCGLRSSDSVLTQILTLILAQARTQTVKVKRKFPIRLAVDLIQRWEVTVRWRWKKRKRTNKALLIRRQAKMSIVRSTQSIQQRKQRTRRIRVVCSSKISRFPAPKRSFLPCFRPSDPSLNCTCPWTKKSAERVMGSCSTCCRSMPTPRCKRWRVRPSKDAFCSSLRRAGPRKRTVRRPLLLQRREIKRN